MVDAHVVPPKKASKKAGPRTVKTRWYYAGAKGGKDKKAVGAKGKAPDDPVRADALD